MNEPDAAEEWVSIMQGRPPQIKEVCDALVTRGFDARIADPRATNPNA